MPTNLPPDYFNVEARYREASDVTEKIALLEEMYSLVPKHKGTDHLRADLRRQLSKLKEEAQTRKKQGGHHSSFYIEKEGAGQVALIGPTNVGKSALVTALTNATPEVSPAPYTTWNPAPGMMPFEDIQIQLIDTPPMDREFVEPDLFDLTRRVDLALLVVDLQADPLQQIDDTLALLIEHHIVPIHLAERYPSQARTTLVALIGLVNKWDDESLDEDFAVLRELLGPGWDLLPVSALTGRNFEKLKRLVYERLGILRVYARPPGKEPDLERPFVLKKGATVADLGRKIHKDFYEKLKTARVWGSSAFEGQMVPREYVLQEGDIVELKA
jgi:hypothetical protein